MNTATSKLSVSSENYYTVTLTKFQPTMMVPKLRKSESARDEPVPAVLMVFDRTNSFSDSKKFTSNV